MKKVIKIKLMWAIFIACSVAVGSYLIINQIDDKAVFFYSPSKILAVKDYDKVIKVGGIIKKDSVKIHGGGLVYFSIYDYKDNDSELVIKYVGMLPALFREGQGVVAEGTIDASKIFNARALLTKHDERYYPRST